VKAPGCLEVVDQSADMRTLVHPSPEFAPGHGELSAGAVVKVSSVTGPLRAGHLASGADRAGPGASNHNGDQDAGFSTIDSKRIAPVASSRTRKRKGWSMTTGCVYARIAVGPTEIPVAAAAVVPFGVTCR
jgi:hypothetical protein